MKSKKKGTKSAKTSIIQGSNNRGRGKVTCRSFGLDDGGDDVIGDAGIRDFDRFLLK